MQWEQRDIIFRIFWFSGQKGRQSLMLLIDMAREQLSPFYYEKQMKFAFNIFY